MNYKIFTNIVGQVVLVGKCRVTGKPIYETADCSEFHLLQVATNCLRRWNATPYEICSIASERFSKLKRLQQKRSARRAARIRCADSIEEGFLASVRDLKMAGFLE